MTAAVFPTAARRAGMYESFYLRAVDPEAGRGVWIRHTVHKRPGEAPRASIWVTAWEAPDAPPFAHKATTERLTVPPSGWIAIGDVGTGDHATFGTGGATGRCGPASWSLAWTPRAEPLRHLRRESLYRAPVPRTKLTSPAPSARFRGTVQLGDRTLDVDGWPGMVGHNWGAEHAERWVWLHGVGFAEDDAAWIDVAVGRIRVGGRLSPWVANGAIALAGRVRPLGGLLARGVRVREQVGRLALELPGDDGLRVEATVAAERDATVAWRYADPDGGEHDVANCSVASLTLAIRDPALTGRTLHTAHGATYELGMRETDHGLALQPFPDG
jgi:hypothetical protein